MTLQLIAGSNSYVLLAEADAYLEGSIQYATAWAGYTDAAKELALVSSARSLERESWEGDESGVTQVTAAVLAAAGTGYAEGDTLVVAGGVFGVAALLEVLTVDGGGEVLTFKILHTGFYTTEPASPVATTSSGAGINCTLTLTFSAQLMDWPRTITSCPDLVVPDTTIPDDIKAAQCELAAYFAANPTAEVGSGADITGTNIKKVEAGSAKVTYFSPQSGSPYPLTTWQLLSKYRLGACTTSAGMTAFGTGDSSAFTDVCDNYGLTRGYA
jgi:hypothetical protein